MHLCLPACLLQLNLHRSAPKGSLSLAQQQLLAEATVAVAFTRRQPLLLLQAAGAFKQLEQAAAQVRAGQETLQAVLQLLQPVCVSMLCRHVSWLCAGMCVGHMRWTK